MRNNEDTTKLKLDNLEVWTKEFKDLPCLQEFCIKKCRAIFVLSCRDRNKLELCNVSDRQLLLHSIRTCMWYDDDYKSNCGVDSSMKATNRFILFNVLDKWFPLDNIVIDVEK